MERFLKKNRKYIGSLLIAVVVFNFLFLPLTALAKTAPAKDDSSLVDQVIGWVSGKALLFVSSTISMLLGAVFGFILYLEAQIIDHIISPANFSFTNSPVVTLGWGITRDLANMFFILILLVIAFATVLKIQSYAIKQLWWKVLVAALLINFSLVIAGFVIDFTQILTTFFLKHATGGGSFGTITTRLASSMQILNFYNPAAPKTVWGMDGGIAQFGASAIAGFLGIILTLVGLVITVFVFGAAMIFLIVRILYIWFLLIVAPLVWMLWILPATSEYFKQWWDNFIKWTFFAPVYVFMIYLSLSIFEANGKLNPKAFWAVSIPGWNTPAPGLTTVGMPAAIFQWILVIAMMFGSLIVALKFGVAGAKAVQGATKGAAKASALWGIKTQGRIATAIGGAAAGTGAGGAEATGKVTGVSRSSAALKIITTPIRGAGAVLKTIGAYATGAKGGKFTAPLAKTHINPLKAILNGAAAGSGLWKKKTQKFKLPSGETIELEPVEEKKEKERDEKEGDKKATPQEEGRPIFEETIEEKNWRCMHDSNVQVLSKKKPTIACPKAATHPAGAPPADWVEV